MTAQTMQPHSLCIAIADKLRERILSHQMPPGSDINDGALAREFGVSRTPVREAMKLLCHEGLLTAQPRRGMSVTRLTPAQVLEARQLCELLAGHLARLQNQPHTVSTALTQQLHAVALARLQLAPGKLHDRSSPALHLLPAFSNLNPEHHPALAL
ncbi:MAG: GntR family transcriptional regulator [Comamonas sp.]|jgi:DNA-binding GntR family transcriptional regulator|uniref:GntR family transcriptional regulator n=1 Tax=Comamonas sp. TaxID=34028 RepID=UPI00282B055C|nr:GntR family transcriptional regulator [Comamonas sp.]MDR0214722.1 GntR family transcriptional regulator [Comamonas sp.]